MSRHDGCWSVNRPAEGFCVVWVDFGALGLSGRLIEKDFCSFPSAPGEVEIRNRTSKTPLPFHDSLLLLIIPYNLPRSGASFIQTWGDVYVFAGVDFLAWLGLSGKRFLWLLVNYMFFFPFLTPPEAHKLLVFIFIFGDYGTKTLSYCYGWQKGKR